MTNPLTGWRLPLRLAARDLMRHKGRSALAALLIFLPVFTLAAALSGITTFDVDERESARAGLVGMRGTVTFEASSPMVDARPFPAAGRVVSAEHPPTVDEVSEQAGRPATVVRTVAGNIEHADGGRRFAGVQSTTILADLTSPVLSKLVTRVEGRLPRTSGEVAITDYGTILGVPDGGKISLYTDGSKPVTVTVVGRVRTPAPGVALVGAPIPAMSRAGQMEFALGGSTPLTAETANEWAQYGATMTTPDNLPVGGSAAVSPSTRLLLAMATMGFVAVVALLAGPAFAAGATRQRRTLGLFAANGAPRAVLRRIVLAQALTLGALSALVSTLTGTLVGALVARYVRVRWYGYEPPIDIRVTWLVGLVVVSTVAALVAAMVPARAAGRTNLLQALRGQVSPRTVRTWMPIVGVLAVILGCALLYRALVLSEDPGNDGTTRVQTLLVYLGVPLFFGGATMTVPFVLRATGTLAKHLPLAGRIAVRDVSRQRTRATASVGAVLATVAVCTSASILFASEEPLSCPRVHAHRLT